METNYKVTWQSGMHTKKGRIVAILAVYHREEGWSPILWDLKVPSEAFILTCEQGPKWGGA